MSQPEGLELRVMQLEYRVKQLLMLVDAERLPFVHLVLSDNLTEAQATAIYDLMDRTREDISSGQATSFIDFEKRIYDIVPAQRNDHHFVARIVRALKENYADIYQYLKDQGLSNL
jgi:hypothetical protein